MSQSLYGNQYHLEGTLIQYKSYLSIKKGFLRSGALVIHGVMRARTSTHRYIMQPTNV